MKTMTDKYIKRDDALFELYRYASAKDPALMIAYRVDLCERIKKIPAADVAEVVYCSECFYHYDDGDHKCKKLRIPCPDDSEFFCKYGKRKG